MAESRVKGKLSFDTSELQQGTQVTVDGLKQIASQVATTSEAMVTKSEAMAQAAAEAASSISEAERRVAEATKASIEAKKELTLALRDVKAGAGDSADALILLAEAQQNARLAASDLSAANGELASSVESLRTAWQEELVAQDLRIAKEAEVARTKLLSALQADIVARSSLAATSEAWQQELLAQDRRIAKEMEVARAKELAALQAGIIARNSLNAEKEAWQQELIAQDRRIEKEAEVARAKELGALKADILERSLAGALEHVGSASHEAVTGVQATSAAIRSLEGNAGLRAVENFIAKTLGLGPLLKNIFPAVGALAFADIIVDMGQKMLEAFDLGGEHARALDRDIRSINATLEMSNTSLDIQIGKLQQEAAKLEKKPFNGLKLALDEATQAAQNLQQRLSGVFEAQKKAIEGASGSWVKRFQSEGGSTKYENVLLEEHARRLEEATTAQDKLKESKSHAASLQIRLNDLLLKRAGSWNSSDAYGNEIRAIRDLIGWQQLEQANIQKTINSEKQLGVTQGARDASGNSHLASEAASKAAANKYRQFEAGLVERQNEGPVSPKEVYEYWGEVKAAFAKGSREYNEAEKKQTEVALQGKAAAAAMIKKAKEEQKKLLEEGGAINVKLLSATNPQMGAIDPTKWDGYNRELARAGELQASLDARIAESDLRMMEATGTLSPLAAAQTLAAIHAREHMAALKALEAELERLEGRAKKDPLTGNYTDPKQAEDIQRVKNQIGQQKGAGAITSKQDGERVAQAMARPYLHAVDEVEAGWSRAQRQILAGQKSFAQAMKGMWGDIAMSAVQNIEHIGFNFIRNEVMMLARKAAAKTAEVGIDAAGAAAATGIAKTSNAEQGLGAAKMAFKNTYATVSGWPVVGPILAPILAPAAFAAVAAFEQGTPMVPRAGIAMLHPGEAVLGSPSAQVMRDAFAGKLQSNSSSMNVHLGGNNFAQAGGDFRSQWAANERHVVRRLKALRREGHL